MAFGNIACDSGVSYSLYFAADESILQRVSHWRV